MTFVFRASGLVAPASSESRNALRKAVRLRARLRDRGATRFAIDVTDLSATGFRAETAYNLRPGTVVWISLPGLAGLEAIIAWRTHDSIGAAFRSPLHPAVFDHIVEMSCR